MLHFVLAALIGAAAARPQLLPAGVDPLTCANYPYCGAQAPAALPTPVVNGENIAPVLNTNPAQTLYHQASQVGTSPAHFPVTVVDGQNVAPGMMEFQKSTDYFIKEKNQKKSFSLLFINLSLLITISN